MGLQFSWAGGATSIIVNQMNNSVDLYEFHEGVAQAVERALNMERDQSERGGGFGGCGARVVTWFPCGGEGVFEAGQSAFAARGERCDDAAVRADGDRAKRKPGLTARFQGVDRMGRSS